MKLAVIGSRDFNDYTFLCNEISRLSKAPKEIISGGARGVDTLAEKWSKDHLGVEATVLKANWYPKENGGVYDKGAGFKRNVEIIKACDAVLAIWDSESSGTIHSINTAIMKNKPTRIVYSKYVSKFQSGNILKFQNEDRWLSNMWPVDICLKGHRFLCAESAYQAAKFIHCSAWRKYKFIYGIEAKKRAKQDTEDYGICANFNDSRIRIMTSILKEKFIKNPYLAAKLVSTYPYDLIEGNSWNDLYWGICDGQGNNNLGIILSSIRKEIIESPNLLPEEIRWICYEARCKKLDFFEEEIEDMINNGKKFEISLEQF